jgi:hypothetical protein
MQVGDNTNTTGLPSSADLYSEFANNTSSFLLDATRIALSTAELAHKKLDELTASSVARDTAVAIASISMCVFCVACAACSFLKSSRRREENRLMVRIADDAPIDDRDEHESEQHMDPRLAAPGDSDAEEAEDGTSAPGPKDRLTGQASRTV